MCWRQLPATSGDRPDRSLTLTGVILKPPNADARVSVRVMLEYLRRDGYEDGVSILKDYRKKVRPLQSRSKSGVDPAKVSYAE